MVKHKAKYIKFFNYGEQDFIPCEMCGQVAVDVHHITYRSSGGKDEIENLIALCRSCHSLAHGLGKVRISKQCLQEKHKRFLKMKSLNR